MKSFAVASTSATQIDLCYLTQYGLIHYYYDHNGNWIGSGQFNSRDLLGGFFNSTVAAVSAMAQKPPVNAPGASKYPRLDLFGLGNDYAFWHQTIWSSVPDPNPVWQSLGGSFLSTPSAIVWNERIEVFGLGNDHAVYRKEWDGNSWSTAWERLGGIMSSEVSAVSWGPDRLDIFARGSDYTLRHRAFNGSVWLTDWENFGGSLASQPAAVSWGPNRIDIFAVSNDGSMIHKWWDGSLWNEWEALPISKPGLTYTGIPAVATWGPNRLDVFNTGSDGILYQLVFDKGAWANPVSLGGAVSAPVSVIALAPDQLLLLKFEGSRQAMANFYAQGVWKQWNFLDAFPQASPGALPNRYIFEVKELAVITTRSLNGDTDTVQSTLNAGNWPSKSATYPLHNDIGGVQEPSGASIQNCSFGPVAVELCESVVFNYQVMNAADKNASGVLDAAGKNLAGQASTYVSKAIGAGVSAITSVEIGGVASVPVIGPILAFVEGWLLGQLQSIITANCDGLVAVEQVVKLGKDLQLLTAAGPFTMITTHPGTDSKSGCGSNSKYTVTWVITPVSPAMHGYMNPPAITASVPVLTFPAQQIGASSAQQSVQITATVKQLAVSSIQIVSDSGAAGDFACVPSGSPPPGGSLKIQNNQFTITVWFRPTAAGPRNARIQITNNISSSPLVVQLGGTGDATPLPLLSASPAALNFTPKKVTPHSVTLVNTGTAPLVISDITTRGGNFSATNTCGVGPGEGTLQPGQKCTINVSCTFSNSSTEGSLLIGHNAVGSPTSIGLSATSKTGGTS